MPQVNQGKLHQLCMVYMNLCTFNIHCLYNQLSYIQKLNIFGSGPQPVGRSKHHVQNTLDFVEKVRAIFTDADETMVSYDVMLALQLMKQWT